MPVAPNGAHAIPTNRSGSITTGGSAQSAAAANAARNYLLIQNKTTAAESFWVNCRGADAVADSPSVEVAPGVTLMYEGGFVPTGAISVIAATTGTKFTIEEA